MTEGILKDLCLCGETTKVQFKEMFTSQKEIAKEMVAFANSKGGVILFGVEDKTGKPVGLSYDQIQIIWRTIQKNDFTTQKETLKDSGTTQKNNSTTQKSDSTTQKESLKDSDTTQKRVLEFFKEHPTGTRAEAAETLGDITEDGVKFIIGKLQQKGLLKRVGGRKHGEWQVLIDE